MNEFCTSLLKTCIILITHNIRLCIEFHVILELYRVLSSMKTPLILNSDFSVQTLQKDTSNLVPSFTITCKILRLLHGWPCCPWVSNGITSMPCWFIDGQRERLWPHRPNPTNPPILYIEICINFTYYINGA